MLNASHVATIYFLLIPQLPYILLHDRLTDGSIYDTHEITFSLSLIILDGQRQQIKHPTDNTDLFFNALKLKRNAGV